MKKIVMILIAVIGFGISAFAQNIELTRTVPEEKGIRVYFKVHNIYQEGIYNKSGQYAGKNIVSINVKICSSSEYLTRVITKSCDYKSYTPPKNATSAPYEESILFTCDPSQVINRCGISHFTPSVHQVITR